MPPTEKVLYTKREAAQLLSISLRSLDYLIFSQQLPARRIGRRVLVHRDSIEQFARLDHASIRALESVSA
ncbi:MAG: helix-turn-helix domain-containing protein [Candidatus Acidiferrales bacterium]